MLDCSGNDVDKPRPHRSAKSTQRSPGTEPDKYIIRKVAHRHQEDGHTDLEAIFWHCAGYVFGSEGYDSQNHYTRRVSIPIVG